jgi:hypothetical protein
MTAPDPESLLRHALKREAVATPECLDDETIAALAEGTRDAAIRTAAVAHLANCARCRAAVASVARAVADPSIAREITSLGRSRRRVLAIGLPIAAAAVLLVIALPRASEKSSGISLSSCCSNGSSAHRAPTITAVSSPALLAPVGIVAAAPTLRWSSVAGADRYRTTLFDHAGAVLYETQTTDTVIALPDSVRFSTDRSYLWKVEARTGWGRWSSSELIEFSIR